MWMRWNRKQEHSVKEVRATASVSEEPHQEHQDLQEEVTRHDTP